MVEVTTWDLEKDESSSNLWLLSTDGTTQTQLTNTTGKNNGPIWSPDGKLIAFTSQRAGDSGVQIYVISPSGGEARRVSNMAMARAALKWSADSRTDLLDRLDVARRGGRRSLQGEGQSPQGGQEQGCDHRRHRVSRLGQMDRRRQAADDFATDHQTGRHRNLLAKSKRFLPPTEPPPSASDYDVSPDGKQLCFVADSSADRGLDFNSDLYTLDLSSESDPKNITTDNEANDTSPVYSPDGKHMAFLRQTIKFFSGDRRRLMVLDRESGAKLELAAAIQSLVPAPKVGRLKTASTFEAENGGTSASISPTSTARCPPPNPRPFPNGRSICPRQASSGLPPISFNRPASVVAHGPGLKDPVPLEHFNDSLEAEWKLGKVEYMTFKGAGDKNVPSGSSTPPTLIRPRNGRSCKWCTADLTWESRTTESTTGISSCGPPRDMSSAASTSTGRAATDRTSPTRSPAQWATSHSPTSVPSTDWFKKQPWIDKDRMVAAGGELRRIYDGLAERPHRPLQGDGVPCGRIRLARHDGVGLDSGPFRSRRTSAWGDLSIVDNNRPSGLPPTSRRRRSSCMAKNFRVPVTQGLAYFNTLRQKACQRDSVISRMKITGYEAEQLAALASRGIWVAEEICS